METTATTVQFYFFKGKLMAREFTGAAAITRMATNSEQAAYELGFLLGKQEVKDE